VIGQGDLMAKSDEIMEGVFAGLGSPSELRAWQAQRHPAVAVETNSHIHIPPNFSAFKSVEQAVALAKEQGIRVLGSSNYYEFSVYRQFAGHCAERGVFPLFGLEVIMFDEGLARGGVRLNDTKNPGKMYLCGKGLSRFLEPTIEAARKLGEIKAKDEGRAREMIRRLNEYFKEHGVAVEVAYEDVAKAVAARYGVAPETVCLQERHLAEAYQRELFSLVPPGERQDGLTGLLGAVPRSVDHPVMVQEDIRTHLMKTGRPGYVEEEFITFEAARRLIAELGGVACYPVLIDETIPLSEFEASPEGLAAELRAMDIYLAEFIPGRSALDVLTRYVEHLRGCGMAVTCGTEHNTTKLGPLAPFCAGGVPLTEELKGYFWEGACVVAAHQYLRLRGENGYVDPEGGPALRQGEREERIREFASLGEAVIREYWERCEEEGVSKR